MSDQLTTSVQRLIRSATDRIQKKNYDSSVSVQRFNLAEQLIPKYKISVCVLIHFKKKLNYDRVYANGKIYQQFYTDKKIDWNSLKIAFFHIPTSTEQNKNIFSRQRRNDNHNENVS